MINWRNTHEYTAYHLHGLPRNTVVMRSSVSEYVHNSKRYLHVISKLIEQLKGNAYISNSPAIYSVDEAVVVVVVSSC